VLRNPPPREGRGTASSAPPGAISGAPGFAAGAGFVIPITGEILRMPGLPAEPLAERFDLTADGEIALH